MNFETFKNIAKENSIIPVYQTITGDMLTPVLAYLKLRENGSNTFLLESVEGIGRLARYSFIGRNPEKIISNAGNKLLIKENGTQKEFEKNIFDYLSETVAKFNSIKLDELPYFTGGLVGYLGFENISLIEDVINFDNRDDLEIPDSVFGLYKNIVVFDHYKHQIILISNIEVKDLDSLMPQYEKALAEINILKLELTKPFSYKPYFKKFEIDSGVKEKNDYCEVVDKCKEHIFEGDIIQIVPSMRFKTEYEGDLFNIYRALRIINPSPYMYYFEFENDFKIIGTSPEDLLRVNDNRATILPIAGTRRRGKTDEEDINLEKELINDPKEKAEHVMLVDLARNDLGRVCEYDSVVVTEEMKVHRYSHVMHIVSRVEGNLKENKNAIDALKASFPAGTVSGAPKIRAVQLINKYENIKRNLYAGAVGYIDLKGNLDLCIAIRTFFAKGNKLYWQAGAGVVADSVPELEYKECLSKAAVLKNALNFAEEIDENFSN